MLSVFRPSFEVVKEGRNFEENQSNIFSLGIKPLLQADTLAKIAHKAVS
jgi:hypothetical protein